MKKIKKHQIQGRIELQEYTFIFDEIGEAAGFISRAVRHAEDPEDVERFEIFPIVEYEEEVEPIYCETDSLKEADKMKMNQLLNEEYGTAVRLDKEVINNEDVHQD